MRKESTMWLFALFGLVIPAAAYVLVNWYSHNYAKLPVLGPAKIINGKQVSHQVSDFHLLNQAGETRSTDNWKGKIVIADFFFTHCPTICPKMTASLRKVQDAYAGDKEILINSFSVDPERDSPEQLTKYTIKFKIDNRNWDLLTGSKPEIYKLARNSFLIVATDGDGGPNDFIHSEKLVLLDKQKRIRGYYDGTSDTEVNQLITDIKKLKNES